MGVESANYGPSEVTFMHKNQTSTSLASDIVASSRTK